MGGLLGRRRRAQRGPNLAKDCAVRGCLSIEENSPVDWRVGLQEIADLLPQLSRDQRMNLTQLGGLVADGLFTEFTARSG